LAWSGVESLLLDVQCFPLVCRMSAALCLSQVTGIFRLGSLSAATPPPLIPFVSYLKVFGLSTRSWTDLLFLQHARHPLTFMHHAFFFSFLTTFARRTVLLRHTSIPFTRVATGPGSRSTTPLNPYLLVSLKTARGARCFS